ncbi:hypothetical protein [Pseudozobellia sp. WGM2]|uniref:HYC_CC_PP family protein n=1 Tax=Pseudozobellia sp. WGM2 TaxID=2787625 RepID=UPI001ADF34E8|nr:hypothetical protein [Pseudozobellia sp. WGM2]
MKEKLHRIFSCLMALLLLLSTTSWKVEKHYCMGRLMDVSFFVDAQDCGMDMTSGAEQETVIEKKSCCDSEVILLEGQDDVASAHNDFDIGQLQFAIAYVYSYFGLFEPHTAQRIPYEHYSPPLIVRDIQLLDDVFLI